MSLTKQQKLSLRQAYIFAYADREQDDKPYFRENGEEKDFIIPSFPEIFDKMCNNILKGGFKKVERCAPSEANCIIRVYQRLHYEYDWDLVFNLYGARCYTKFCGKWTISDGIDTYPIRYDKHSIRLVLGPDESPTIDTKFADYYVWVS